MNEDFVKVWNITYQILKWLVILVLPASATFYMALAGYWNLPYPEQVVGTITATDAFLGTILGISTIGYKALVKDN